MLWFVLLLALRASPIIAMSRTTAKIGMRMKNTSSPDAVSLMDKAIAEIKRLRQENATLTAERDEARREVCGLLVACHTDPDDEKPDPNLKNVHAGIRGWDCFKENTNG